METNTQDYRQENFSLPHDIVPLPSEGVFYRNGKKSIKVGYLTAMDENIMLGGGDITSNLLRSKIYEPDMKIEDLLEGDIEAVLIFLRNTSFGPEINLTVRDPKTDKTFTTTVSLEQLSIIKGENPNPDGTFTVTLPKSGATVKLKPLTFGQISEINKIIDNYPAGRIAPKVTLKLQKQLVEVNGSTNILDISKFVEQMPIFDSKYIKKFMDENEPRLDMKKTVTTPSGEKLTVNVGFGVDFFRPFF